MIAATENGFRRQHPLGGPSLDRHAIDLYHMKQTLGLSCGEETTRQYTETLRQQPTKAIVHDRSPALPTDRPQKMPSRHFLHLALGRNGI
ncbi:hypothetical protein [Blastopirellula marina]|uniref:Uncharacterized protein n=1 Tax=Blastopirellula marina TaxID=124 RepID=A0A2S8G6X5_9BACT|nr:hypothetical protein [Blastopirellula marina]PQO40177.1 hypothetical protein C5Y98_06110 [Blastopirellula marina]PTL45544.1 hypothetical protein C5Y97_06110 [Blastopirellula marina]